MAKVKEFHLVVTKKWYDMQVNGIKNEEYREYNQFWKTRIGNILTSDHDILVLVLHCGYTSKIAKFRVIEISLGIGKQDWGAPKERCFVIRHGKCFF